MTAPRKRLLRSLCLALLGVASLVSLARAQAPATAPDAATIAKFDKDKNGRLDADELAAMSSAQSKNAKIPVESESAKESGAALVTLSPFEVVADDNGYLASNTLSGTRLNSKIEDLGASITVVTKQQMLDTAVLDINDIFLYEANTEGTGNYTALVLDRNGGVNDSIQSGPQTANRIRGIDSVNTARGNFASNSSIPIDMYNTDAVEISRGPNSNIFGLGNTSGTVNIIPSKANLTRDISTVVMRADSYGGYRGSIDLNRPLFRNVLALRLSAVYQSVGYQRKPSADQTKRQQGAVTYKPFANTTIRGSYESYHNYARRPNSVTPRDTATYWKSVGSPTWDPQTQIVSFANGTTSGPYTVAQDGTLPFGLLSQGSGFYNRPSIFVDNGAIQFWSVNRTGSLPASGIPTPDNPNSNLRFIESGNDIQRLRGTSLPLFIAPATTDKAVYDWTSINFVAPNYNQDKADIYSVEVEQGVFKTAHQRLDVRGGWFREDTDNYSRNFIGGTNAVLYVDPNRTYLDGRLNPFFKRPYIGASEPTLSNRPTVNDIQIADLAYQLTPSHLPRWLSWIGQQKLAAHGEVRRLDTAIYRYRDFILDDHTWGNPANRGGPTAGRGYYKYYLGDDKNQNIDYAPPPVYSLGGKQNFNWFDAKAGVWVSEPSLIGESGVTPSNRTRREIRTQSLATQNFFFDDRIVTTFGWRKDKNRSRDSNGATVDPATGLLNYDALRTWGPFLEKSGDTKTAGVVVKPFSWLYAHYNQSDSFQPATTQYNLLGEVLPNPTGKGKDYGVSFNLWAGKLFLKVNKYTTEQRNSRGGDAGNVAPRALRIDSNRATGNNDAFNFETWATNLSNSRFLAQGITPTAAQTTEAVSKIMGLPVGFIDSIIGKSIAETSDISAKGYEFELNFNPNRNWTLKATAAQQQSIDNNIGPALSAYLDSRLPIWTTAKDDAGNLWWKTNTSAGTAENFYIGSVSAPLKLAQANQGKPRTQVREWRFNAITNYNFTQGRLKNFSVGGAVRWEDKASIGFRGAAPDADGVIRTLDRTKPLFDKSRYYFDASAGYNLRLYSGKIRTRIQLNVRNAFENGRLQAVAVNPDGQPYAYRIIDPRQFILTTTFDL